MKTTTLIVSLMLLALFVGAEPRVHVVQRGDTIFSISRRYNVSVDALQRENSISDPSVIRVGQRLTIPGTSPSRRHTVVRGETYFGIARQYNISLAQLLEANNRTAETVLRVGDVLTIPGGNAVAGGSQPAQQRTPAQQTPQPAVTPARTTIAPQVAPTVTLGDSSQLWPHPGRRSVMEGKFPGIRIDGSRGDMVVAVAAGQVIYSGPHSSFGRVVFVQNPAGFIYVYGGNDELLVQVGDRVQVGTAIGTVGTSSSGGAHVFFTVWRDNRFVDPGRAPRG